MPYLGGGAFGFTDELQWRCKLLPTSAMVFVHEPEYMKDCSIWSFLPNHRASTVSRDCRGLYSSPPSDSLEWDSVAAWSRPDAGPIPPSLGKLSWLERLDLSNNQLTGEEGLPCRLAGVLVMVAHQIGGIAR